MAKLRKFAAIYFTLIFLLSGMSGFAQNPSSYYVEETHTFRGGLVAGANFCQVDGDNYRGYHKAAINAGGIMYMHLDDDLSLSMELLYSQKGSHGHFDMETTDKSAIIKSYNINLNYAEIPIMINYYDKRKSHISAGFSYSKLLNSQENITIYDGAVNRDVNTSLFPFNKDNFDFLIGGSMNIKGGWFLNLRFQYSITPIRNTVDGNFGRDDQHSNLWTLRVMYLF